MFRPSSAHLVLFFLLPALAYIITIDPYQTDRPAPGTILFFDIQVQFNDSVLVDILLFNGILGNTTTLFPDSDLRKDQNSGFEIPSLPPGTAYAIRLVETSTQRFLQDSPPFQIFAVGSSGGTASQSTSDMSSTMSSAGTTTPASSSMSLPTTAGAQGDTGRNKTSEVGPIVGGVIGGLLVIVVAIAIILWRRRSPPTNESEKALQVPPGSVQPFVINASQSPGVEIPGSNSTDPLTYTTSLNGIVKQPGPLHKKSAYGYGVQMDALGDGGSQLSRSNMASVRAEFLRKERDRINRELASLENGASSGTDSSESSSDALMTRVPSVAITSTINDQLVSLREQIRQIETRQMYGTTEPPPGYSGSSRSTDVEDD